MKFKARMKKLMQLLVENYNPKAVIKSEVRDGRGRIYIYDVISDYWGVGPDHLVRALDEIGDLPVDVFINSPGGDVFDGRAMKTVLERHENEVVVYIDGIAASAATTVACGGDRRIMAEGTRFMIHNAWTIALGNAGELRKMADLLDQLDDDIAADYMKLMGASKDEVMQLMADETYFSAEECLENGLCDEIAGAETSPTEESEDKDESEDTGRNNLERLGRFAQMLEDIG